MMLVVFSWRAAVVTLVYFVGSAGCFDFFEYSVGDVTGRKMNGKELKQTLSCTISFIRVQ